MIFVSLYKGLVRKSQFYAKDSDPTNGAKLDLEAGDYTLIINPEWLPNRKRDLSIRVHANHFVRITRITQTDPNEY